MNKKILIVGPSWVGDMVMAQSLFKALAEQSDCQIDVIAPDWSRPLLERMPEVSRAHPMPIGHGKLLLGERRQIGRSLIPEQYDEAYVLPNSFKSALIPFWAKIPKRVGWRGEMRYGVLTDARPLDKEKYPLMVQRFVALAYPKTHPCPQSYPHPSLMTDAQTVADAQQKYQLNTDKPVLALCPGAEFGPSKQWPIDSFSDIANSKLAEGWQVWLFGSKNDQATANLIQEKTQAQCVNLCGQTSLAEAIDLLSLSSVVVSNDSGLMHIASALNKPVVALYGSTSPSFTPPLGDKVEMLSANINCSPCFKRECPLSHHNCMKKLSPATVVGAIDTLVEL